MTPENFCYWLQGFFEITETDKNKKSMSSSLSMEQTQMIKEHLELVFKEKVKAELPPLKWPGIPEPHSMGVSLGVGPGKIC